VTERALSEGQWKGSERLAVAQPPGAHFSACSSRAEVLMLFVNRANLHSEGCSGFCARDVSIVRRSPSMKLSVLYLRPDAQTLEALFF
jgi:hypothetical protein